MFVLENTMFSVEKNEVGEYLYGFGKISTILLVKRTRNIKIYAKPFHVHENKPKS